MFRFIRKLVFLLFFFVIILVVGRNTIGAWIVESSFKRMTGFPTTIGYLNFALTQPYFIIRDITVRNPEDRYQETRAIKMNLLESDYELASFFRDEIHFQKLVLDIKEIVAVRNAHGEINLRQLQKNVNSSHPSEGKFKVDELALSLEDVLYVDEKQVNHESKLYKVNIKNRIYKNIQRPKDIQKVVLNLVAQTLPQNLGITSQKVGQEIEDVSDLIERTKKSWPPFFRKGEKK